MEKMSQREKDLLLSLQAKAKRIQRAEEEFFKEADLRKDELLKRWGLVAEAQANAKNVPAEELPEKEEKPENMETDFPDRFADAGRNDLPW